ncbi:M1 family aminopeptidase [Sanyastnella coralliicola]|uniref:T9SS type A sorting domain-containing protein n=1 Tax=Sanyastnella coralliicola TaxID=3069118 RepID=UPI0027BA5822|nr:M1 family aminopeptidase [Longitalea sp. SCSIO 12813]
MTRSLLLLALVLLSVSALAQKEYFGCHNYRNRVMPESKKLTHAQQKALQTSILRSDTIDIQHYDIFIDVTDYGGGVIDAATTITYSPIEPDRESIILDLFQLQVDSVVDATGQLTYTHDGEFLQVYFDESPEVGETYDMTVYYQGDPHQDPGWGGFYFQSFYIYNLGIGLTTVPPNFGKVWYPCFDTFLERASYTYRVRSANGMVASCQGDLVEEIIEEGDTLTRVFEFPGPIPTYLSAIAVAEYETTSFVHEGVYGDVDVTLTSKPEHQGAMNNTFQEVGIAIDACEYWWGPNPWSRVGYVYTTDGALEIPTNIAYPQFMANESLNSNAELFTHELGHYWWGDVITMIEHNHMWIKEGPAEYSSQLFFEWRDGWEEFTDVVKDNQLFVLEECHVQDNGFHAMSPMPDEEIYGRTTYQKGASVLHNLRAYLGDELFRDGMMTMQESMPYSNVNAAEFRDSLSMYTGYDLTDFFDDQIFNPGFSVFVLDSVSSTDNGSGYTHTLYLQQKLRECPDFYDNVPLEVSAIGADWSKENFMVNATGQYSTATIETDEMPALIELNTNGRLNQSRLDTEFVIDDTSSPLNRPFVDFRLGTNEINEGDSAWVRVEHIWAGPDNDNLMPYIYEISSTHFWKVSGIFPEGIEMDGRLTYAGDDPIEDLDNDLYGVNENDAMLVWRPDAYSPWMKYPDYEWQGGNLNNGAGQFVIEPLLPGQYAFANGDVAAAIASAEAVTPKIYPNPSNGVIQLELPEALQQSALITVNIIDMNGRTVMNTTLPSGIVRHQLDLSTLSQGSYLVQLLDQGTIVSTSRIELLNR